jgi:transposase
VGRPGPRKIDRYSLEFKRTAVKLSQMRDVEVQAVAEALDIHPFMLSRWRKEAREGLLKGRGGKLKELKRAPVREIKRLQALEREHELLKEEHELLKKVIRFCSARRRKSSRSSRPSAGDLR